MRGAACPEPPHLARPTCGHRPQSPDNAAGTSPTLGGCRCSHTVVHRGRLQAEPAQQGRVRGSQPCRLHRCRAQSLARGPCSPCPQPVGCCPTSRIRVLSPPSSSAASTSLGHSRQEAALTRGQHPEGPRASLLPVPHPSAPGASAHRGDGTSTGRGRPNWAPLSATRPAPGRGAGGEDRVRVGR